MARTRPLTRWVAATLVVACAMCATGALALGAGAAPTATSPVPPASYYGADVEPIFEKGFVAPSGWNALIADMSPDHFQVARMEGVWAWAEPNAPVNGVPTYTWNPPADPTHSIDNLVSMFASNDVRMLAVLAIPPAWAGGGGDPMSPAHYGDFVAYAAAFAQRYGEGGTFWAQHPALPYLPVQQFEVWSEANTANFWLRQADPSEYVKVLKPLYAAVHAVDPSAQVLASIGWPGAAAYVTELYQDGVKGSIDGIAFHPYAPDAPSTIGLVQQMRATLVADGDPNLPIDDTEVGEPAAANTAADATRAAKLSLIGDALARSDCNVQSFDVYALTASGTNLEAGGEGYMGILNDVTGAPNITGQALIAASQRWQADPTSGLVLCGGSTTPPSTLLPLGLDLTHTSATCVSGTVTYEGNPLQSAFIILSGGGRVPDPAPATTGSGQTGPWCLQNGPPITSFDVYAEVSNPLTTASFTSPNIAQSATYRCPISVNTPTATCTVIAPAPGGGGGGGGGGTTTGTTTTASAAPPITSNATTATTTTTTTSHTTPGSGRGSGGSGAGGRGGSSQTGAFRPAAGVTLKTGCRIRLTLSRVRPGRTALRAELACAHAIPPATRVHVALLRRGRSKAGAQTTVTLAKGKWEAFTVAGALHAGDRIEALAAADAATGVPSLRATLVATAKLLHAAAARHG